MAATVYVYRFEDGITIDIPLLGAEKMTTHIQDAAKAARAKVVVNRVDRGVRTIRVRMPNSDVECSYRLHCLALPPDERLIV